MNVCVENVFTNPAIEAINVIQATAEEAEENDRAASSDPHPEHRETDAEQEAVARGFSPADSPETPQAETAEGEKNPWSAWAWLGLCRTRKEKCLFVGAPAAAGCAPTKSARIPNIVHVDVDAFFASV